LNAERRRKRLRRGIEWLYGHTAAKVLSVQQSVQLARGYGRLKQRLRS
jgi:hypothetical protein